MRLFLDDEQARRLDRLWAEQRFISRQPAAEYDYLPQFMGFTTQDTPKEFQQFFIDRKPLFKKHAEEFEKEEEAAIPKQLDALLRVRRPGLPPAAADDGAGRAARPVRRAPRKGVAARGGVPRGPGRRAGVAGVPVPRRAGPAGQGARAGQRLGAGHAASATSSGRRCPTTSCASSPPRASSATRRCWRRRRSGCSRTPRVRGAGHRVRHAVDSRPRLRRAEGEERKAVPDVRRQAAQGDLRGVDPVLPGPVPAPTGR